MSSDKRVQKFRSIEEMNNTPLPELETPPFERFLRHCARWRAIAPKNYPRGVFKFRSIEEAQKAREQYEVNRIPDPTTCDSLSPNHAESSGDND